METKTVQRTRGVVRTGNVAVAKRALGRTHDAIELEVEVDGAAFQFEETVVASERLSLESTSSTGVVSGTIRTGNQMVVTWLKSGRGSIGEHRAPIGRPILFHQGAEPFRWVSFQQDTLRIDRTVVRNVAAARGGWEPQPLEFKPHHVPEGSTLAAWWLMVRQVAAEILEGPAEVSAERDEELTRVAAAGLLTAIPHWPAGAHGSSPARARLARAETFLLEHAAETIGVQEIAEAAGMSVRGLQSAFQRAHETSPLGYLRGIRLQMAHGLLSTAEVDSVAAAARQVGMSHLSRFAAAFHAEFGERPSQTLRAARAAS
ncbi:MULTISPECIES: AraC family transcriptional regulator [unclassified Curtobacterium]|uniref:helix-turn-helix transcriptional regulator n=1 Tax=unclassified Curtobacterium TaxID=257496 RepID=UPI001404B33E|nr:MULTISPECIES: AraC family transcriptional regulator [unclassified Curtobacterium]